MQTGSRPFDSLMDITHFGMDFAKDRTKPIAGRAPQRSRTARTADGAPAADCFPCAFARDAASPMPSSAGSSPGYFSPGHRTCRSPDPAAPPGCAASFGCTEAPVPAPARGSSARSSSGPGPAGSPGSADRPTGRARRLCSRCGAPPPGRGGRWHCRAKVPQRRGDRCFPAPPRGSERPGQWHGCQLPEAPHRPPLQEGKGIGFRLSEGDKGGLFSLIQEGRERFRHLPARRILLRVVPVAGDPDLGAPVRIGRHEKGAPDTGSAPAARSASDSGHTTSLWEDRAPAAICPRAGSR